MVKTLQLLRNIKKEIKHGEARDLTAVESGVIASSKKINLNKTNKTIIKNEIINLSKNIIVKTELL